MNLELIFKKKDLELYYDDLAIIKYSLLLYNQLVYKEGAKLDELEIHRWTTVKDFYNKILYPKINKGKPSKGIVKLTLLPNQVLTLFHVLNSTEEKNLDLIRIVGKFHHCLINIPHLDYKSITSKPVVSAAKR